MESLLSAGYPDIGTREHAELILKQFNDNQALVPYEKIERARAFLAALDATAEVVSTRPGRLESEHTRENPLVIN